MANTINSLYNDRQPSPFAMRLHSLSLACAVLALPGMALAAPTAADIFATVYETPAPLQYTFESHSEGKGMNATMRASGMQEGRGTDWYKQRSDVTLYAERGGDSVNMHIKMTVFGETMYLRIAGIDVVRNGAKMHMDSTPWAEMPLHGAGFDIGMFPFADLLSALDMDVTGAADMWMQFRKSSYDMMMTSQRYRGGTAYNMSMDGTVTARAKFNTDTKGGFLFGKVYLTQPGFSLSGEVQPYGKGVTLEIPKKTVHPASLRENLERHGIFLLLDHEPMLMYAPNMSKATTTNSRARPAVAGRPVYVPQPEPTCLQTGYAWAGCGIHYTKRALNEPTDDVSFSQGWKQRVGDDRIIEAFDAVARRMEIAARKQRMHEVKAMLSNTTIRASGSDDTNTWLTEDILPFFLPTEPSEVKQTVFLEAENGHRGVALEKVTVTASGRRRYFVVVLLEERAGAVPAVADIFVNATLRDLKGTGWIE